MIYVTHDQVEAMTLGDRVAVMRRGRLQQLDPPQRVYAEPANIFVAAFMGNPPMNMIEARVEADADGKWLVVAHERVPAATLYRGRGVDLAPFVGSSIGVGIRPEAFHEWPVGEGTRTAGTVIVEAGVAAVDVLGPEILAHVDVRGAKSLVTSDVLEVAEDVDRTVADGLVPAASPKAGSGSAQVVIRLPAESVECCRSGNSLRLAFDAGDLHLFDLGTGNRIGDIRQEARGEPTQMSSGQARG
jgi:multiple sugar transport system ATP-binding protein